MVITERVKYINFLVRPNGGRMADYFILSLPKQVNWKTYITGVCDPNAPLKKALGQKELLKNFRWTVWPERPLNFTGIRHLIYGRSR